MMLWESLHFKIQATYDYHNGFNKEIRFPIPAVNKWECLYVLPYEGILREVHTI